MGCGEEREQGRPFAYSPSAQPLRRSLPPAPTCCCAPSSWALGGGCPGMGMDSATPVASAEGKMRRSASAAASALGLGLH